MRKCFLLGQCLLMFNFCFNTARGETANIKLNDAGTEGTGTAIFKNLQDAPGTYLLDVNLPSGWSVVEDATNAVGKAWEKTGDLSGKAVVKSPFRDTGFFGLALKGKMYIKGTKPGEPIPWSAYVDSFYIHSGNEYEKVISPWGQEVSFNAVGGEDDVSWTLTPKAGGTTVKTGTGRTFSITADDFTGENPISPGEYTVAAKDKNNLTDDMTLVIVGVEIIIENPLGESEEPEIPTVHLVGEELRFAPKIIPSELKNEITAYEWSFTEGIGEPDSGDKKDFQTTIISTKSDSDPDVMLHLKLTTSDGNYLEDDRTIKALIPEIVKVNFQNVACSLKSHMDGAIVSSNNIAEWERDFSKDDPKRNCDAAYVKGSKATCKIKCQAGETLTKKTSVLVLAKGKPENLFPDGAYFKDWSEEIHMDDGSPLRESIYQYVNNFDYTWFYKVEKLAGGWGKEIKMKRNPTHHNISITRNTISGPPFQWIVMNLCKLASGLGQNANDKQIVDRIYTDFPDIRASDDLIITNDDWKDMNKLKYGIFGSWTTETILKRKGGMCDGWNDFFPDLA